MESAEVGDLANRQRGFANRKLILQIEKFFCKQNINLQIDGEDLQIERLILQIES